MGQSDLFATVADAVCHALQPKIPRPQLRPETSLLELGLDSLNAVDVTVTLEQALAIERFEFQQWADAEAQREQEPRFTLQSLVEACAARVATKQRRSDL